MSDYRTALDNIVMDKKTGEPDRYVHTPKAYKVAHNIRARMELRGWKVGPLTRAYENKVIKDDLYFFKYWREK